MTKERFAQVMEQVITADLLEDHRRVECLLEEAVAILRHIRSGPKRLPIALQRTYEFLREETNRLDAHVGNYSPAASLFFMLSVEQMFLHRILSHKISDEVRLEICDDILPAVASDLRRLDVEVKLHRIRQADAPGRIREWQRAKTYHIEVIQEEGYVWWITAHALSNEATF